MNSRQIDVRHEFGSVDVDVSIRFESPSYVTDHKVGNASSYYQMFRPSNDFDSSQEDDANFQHRDTLHSLVQSSFRGNRVLNLQEKSIGSVFQQHQSSTRSFSSFDKNYEIMKPDSSQGITSIVLNNVVSQKPILRNRTRIRWTQDLHKKFIDCVNRLGGAKKAKPKGILKLMNCDGLTIFHVKSHLQKYRVSHYISESTEGKGEKSIRAYSTLQLDAETRMLIVEAQRLQKDFQRRLYEQLECQRNLQTRIEEQAKQLKTMFEWKVKTT
ncbi:unnamed protein product [Fraxinus pennsylvanica]|uniref:HTH myb-type domain-containing protein n=1 Tax=Fraxinus pennsylvanica TaxID=56036 RepID=A0AAD2DYP4_9LAMI|nr:unnamed protein product [Fraxinus pennsylvanica]